MGGQGLLSKNEALRLHAAVFLLRLFLRAYIGKSCEILLLNQVNLSWGIAQQIIVLFLSGMESCAGLRIGQKRSNL